MLVVLIYLDLLLPLRYQAISSVMASYNRVDLLGIRIPLLDQPVV